MTINGMEIFHYDLLQRNVEMFNRNAYPASDGAECLICGNKRLIAKLVGGYMIVDDCACKTTANNIRNIDESGLSALSSRYTFDRFYTPHEWQARIKARALEYVDNYRDNWFFIGGQPGCGKSHICTAIMGQLLKKGVTAKYMQWVQDSRWLKGLISEDNAAYQREISVFKRCGVLYIDDFFKAQSGTRLDSAPTQGDINLAFDIINARYVGFLPTIISGEKSIEQLYAIDEAVGSRINERTAAYRLNVGKDAAKNYRTDKLREA